jgi:hypothetical protein
LPGPHSKRSSTRLVVVLAPTRHAPTRGHGDSVFLRGPFEHHDVEGFYLVVGPGLSAGEAGAASVFDVAPTVSAFFGVGAPSDLQGSLLWEINGAPLAKSGAEPTWGAPEQEGPTSNEAPSESLRERLRALGYIDE